MYRCWHQFKSSRFEARFVDRQDEVGAGREELVGESEGT